MTDSNRVVLHATCLECPMPVDFTNLVVRRLPGDRGIELDPHAIGKHAVTLGPAQAKALLAQLAEWF
jgi:hypothetical protein